MKCDSAFKKVHFVTVDKHKVGQRIDNFLLTYLKNVPKSRVYRLIRKGEVRVNKKRIKPEYKLIEGDNVRIPPLFKIESIISEPSSALKHKVVNSIIFDEPGLMCLNKPSGIAVHGGSGLQGGIINILRAALPEYPFLELIHRLDKETSGCLLIAKTGKVLRQLQEAWRENKIDKHYLCLVKGHWPKSLQKIDASLLKNILKSGERKVTVDKNGKMALSYFKPRQYFKNSTLLEVKLVTGRTHQIRVHTAYAGHPIAGDEKYGDRTFNQAVKQIGLKRLFLHAEQLVIPRGYSQMHCITSEIPQDLACLIEKINNT